jgi:hypothetical protein
LHQIIHQVLVSAFLSYRAPQFISRHSMLLSFRKDKYYGIDVFFTRQECNDRVNIPILSFK